jgi:diacylglycerol kinase
MARPCDWPAHDRGSVTKVTAFWHGRDMLSRIMDGSKNGNLLYATRNALAGFPVLLRENAARRELMLVVVALACALFAPGPYSFALFAMSVLLLVVEALNTAIETLCDHVTPERHPEIKAIKDVAAVGVFLTVMLTLGAGTLFLADCFGLLGQAGGR